MVTDDYRENLNLEKFSDDENLWENNQIFILFLLIICIIKFLKFQVIISFSNSSYQIALKQIKIYNIRYKFVH